MIVASVKETWAYESEPPQNIWVSYHVRLRRPRLRPRVVAVRISRTDPRFASALVELRDAHGRRRGTRALLVLERERDATRHGWGYTIAGPAISFPHSCTAATPKAVRDLLCPDPWVVVGYPRPHRRTQTTLTQRIRSPDLHALDWRSLALPGAVCGSSRPIRLLRHPWGGAALLRGDVDHLWWNPLVVETWSKPTFGDLDGDGRDEAAINVDCANGGGTGGGQLETSVVVFAAAGRSLHVVGVLTPRQPLTPDTHVPVSFVRTLGEGRVVVSEGWYGPYDGDCCPSGRARTVWTLRAGRLRPLRTTILRKTWTSPLLVEPVTAEPGDRQLEPLRTTKVVARRGLRFAVTIENLGDVTKRHVKVTLRIRRSPSPIVATRTIGRITPRQFAGTVFFGHFGGLPLGVRTVVTIDLAEPGTYPVRYPVIFTRPAP